MKRFWINYYCTVLLDRTQPERRDRYDVSYEGK